MSVFKRDIAPAPLEGAERRELAHKLAEQAAELLALSRSLASDDAVASEVPARLDEHVLPSSATSSSRSDWKALAERLYRERRSRDRIFSDSALFGEPAWDLLLDLTVSELKGRKLSVTSACIGACVPSTTALRWLSLLEERGLIVRESDATDKRRAFVRISPDGFRKMIGYLESLGERIAA